MPEKDIKKEAYEAAHEVEDIVKESGSKEVSVGGAENVSEILKAVSEFLKSLEGPITKLLDTFLSTLNGEKLGSDVASFYAKLKESGMPDEVAVEMTREYFEKRTSIADITKLIGTFIKKEILEEEEEGKEG